MKQRSASCTCDPCECCECQGTGTCSCDPCECCDCLPEAGVVSTKMWQKAFFEAMHQVHVEKLKKKIEAAWGPNIDKSADAAIESFGKIWQSMLLQSEAKQEFASKLQKIASETRR